MFDYLDRHPTNRLIIDMRQNGGGDFTEVRKHLIPGLKVRSAINRRCHLFVVTGRTTFSAAMSNATDFHKQTHAMLVGEPPGEVPNSYAENRQFTLPNSHLTVSYSTRYYKFLDDDIPALIPDKEIDPNWPDYKAGTDPVLDWILAGSCEQE